jgi:hypothetical protein
VWIELVELFGRLFERRISIGRHIELGVGLVRGGRTVVVRLEEDHVRARRRLRRQQLAADHDGRST